MSSIRNFGLIGLSMAGLLGIQRSALGIVAAVPTNGSASVTFGTLTEPLTDAYALVVLHGSIGTGYYLDDPNALGSAAGTGGLLPLGAVPGSDSFTLSFQYPSYATPLGVIIAGYDANSALSLGLNPTFLTANPSYTNPTDPFSDSPTASTETEATIVSDLQGSAPGSSTYLTDLGTLTPSSAAYVSFTPGSVGELVDFPYPDGQTNGPFTVNPIPASTPLPSPLWAALAGFAGLGLWKHTRKTREIA